MSIEEELGSWPSLSPLGGINGARGGGGCDAMDDRGGLVPLGEVVMVEKLEKLVERDNDDDDD